MRGSLLYSKLVGCFHSSRLLYILDAVPAAFSLEEGDGLKHLKSSEGSLVKGRMLVKIIPY